MGILDQRAMAQGLRKTAEAIDQAWLRISVQASTVELAHVDGVRDSERAPFRSVTITVVGDADRIGEIWDHELDFPPEADTSKTSRVQLTPWNRGH